MEAAVKDRLWYTLEVDEVAHELNTDQKRGITVEEAAKRLDEYGRNALEESAGRTIWQMLFDQFKETLVLILLAAGVVSGILGEWEDTIVILLIVILNAVLGVIQENKAEKSLAALKKLSAPVAHIIRGGRTLEIPAEELVPGDLLLLEAGAYVPADARIVEQANLKVDEATLTGESVPVEKETQALPEKAAVGDQINMVFSGTMVTYGRAKAIVVKTGMSTEIGKIAAMMQSVDQEETPLQRRLEQLGKVLGAVALALVVIIFFAGLLRGEHVLEMFMTSISLAVAAIPEGLPAIVTVVLALGVQRMARRNAIIRKLPAVETLGTATIIASDKTGTLTQNEMTVSRVYVDGVFYAVKGEGYRPEGTFTKQSSGEECKQVGPELALLLQGGALCNDARLEQEEGDYRIIGDPTEGALIVSAAKAGYPVEALEEKFPRVGELPFDSKRKRMTTVHEVRVEVPFIESRFVSFTKGGPDVLLALCPHVLEGGQVTPLTEEKREKLLSINSGMAADALRVLAVAYREWDDLPSNTVEDLENGLVFVGFQGMIDPPRAEVKAAVAAAKGAGIRPIMVTGDHQITAVAIARELGIMDEGSIVISGQELEEMKDDELAEKVKRVAVFARVSPEHKVRIVDALKRNGHVVAMTGDGVNDAPALKKADIGAAMGITGTDVAKEAAEMVLADDNFATIVAAVREGRVIFDNIKKSIHYLLSCNTGEIVAIFSAIMLGWGRPLEPIQILWVNLVTDGLPALALGVEPPEPGIMERRPRDPRDGVFAGGIGFRIVNQGIFIGFLTLLVFWLAKFQWGLEPEKARTLAFATLSFTQLFHAFNTRSGRQSLFRIGWFTNKYMLMAFFGSGLLQVAVISMPILQPIFDVTALSLKEWGWVMAVSALVLFAVEGVKAGERIFRQAI